MNRFLKLTVLFAVAISFSAMASQSFAKGKVSSSARVRTASKAVPARTHKHRINEYGNGLPNPNADSNGSDSGIGTNYPPPTTFGSGSYPNHGGGGNVNPPKSNPHRIYGLQAVRFPTAGATAN